MPQLTMPQLTMPQLTIGGLILALAVFISPHSSARTRPVSSSKLPLPGLLSKSAIHHARLEARQQKLDAQQAMRQAARELSYSERQIELALKPTMVRQGAFHVGLKDGTVVKFPWYRIGFAENRLANTDKIIARDARGNALRRETNKGGIRLHRGVFADEVYALALKMDAKLAVARDAQDGQAFRGAKGGIGAGQVVRVGRHYQAELGDYVDPASPVFSRAEIMQKFAHSYLTSGGAVGLGLDIQAGDVNTKGPELKVLAETYGSRRRPSPGVSGKAVRTTRNGRIDPRGGIDYRKISTGDGVWMATRLAARHSGMKVRGATVVAQGWGEVGRAFGQAALKDGARVIAIQELWNVGGKATVGMLLHPKGARAKPKEIRRWLDEVETFRGSGKDIYAYQGGRLAKHFVKGMDASSVRADIVGINALGGVLNGGTVPAYLESGTHQGKVKILAEGANLAQTGKGSVLLDRHRDRLLTISGDLANLGGVHVSDLEAVQNTSRKAVTSERARRSLQGTMRVGWNKAVRLSQKQGVSIRKAIQLSAVDGVMKRSLHLKGAPLSNMAQRAFGRSSAPLK